MANDSNGKLSPIKVETIHLRVYIHCEGCKKKVRKILTNIEGVSMVEIDASLGKVTVTGTAEVKTIVKKLEKSGKVVELWPAPQPIKLAPLTPQPKENSKEKAKDNNVEKKGQPQPSPQKPAATVDIATKQDISKANSSKKKGAEGSDKQKQCGEDTSPSDQAGTKSASKKSCAAAGDDATKPNLENKTKVKPVEANGDAKYSNGGVPSTSTNSNKKTNKTNNGGGAPNANNDTTKNSESDIASEIEGEKVVSPDSKSGGAEKGSNSSSKKVGEGGKSCGVETNLDDLLVEASTSTRTANRHMAPPPMVLVETSEYSVDMESAEDYATHMFSDENANNCTLM